MVASPSRSRRDNAHQQPARKAARPSNHYTDNAELAELINAWKHSRKRTAITKISRLIAILYQISGGVWDRYEFTANREDFCQDCMFNFFERALDRIDTSKNCFSYLTTCAMNFGNRLRSRAIEDRRAELAYGVDRVARHFQEQFSEC